MRTWTFVFVGVLLLVGASAAMACEKCLKEGDLDQFGWKVDKTICEAGHAKGYATCIPETSLSCKTTKDSTCIGSSGNFIWHQDTLRTGDAEPVAKGCKVDVSGKCSGSGLQKDRFLR
jgi:hypothetical protein